MGITKIPAAKDKWLEHLETTLAGFRSTSNNVKEFIEKVVAEGIEVTYPDIFLKTYWYKYQEEHNE